MVDRKKISVIIPFYNGESYLPRLLNSLKLAFTNCQTGTLSFEVIVIVDSLQTSVNTIKQLTGELRTLLGGDNIIVQKNKHNLGVAASRNVAIALATGDLFHIIDQDDEVTKDFYADATPLLIDNSFILSNGLVCHSNNHYNNHKLYYLSPKLKITGLLKGDFIRSPGQVIFSRYLLKPDLFPEPKTYKGADDRFFWIRLFIENKDNIKPFYIAKPNYIAHIHDDNYSADGGNLKMSGLENWEILQQKTDMSAYKGLVAKDILRIEVALKKELPFLKQLTGIWQNVIYFLEPNKLLRFVVKRKIW